MRHKCNKMKCSCTTKKASGQQCHWWAAGNLPTNASFQWKSGRVRQISDICTQNFQFCSKCSQNNGFFSPNFGRKTRRFVNNFSTAQNFEEAAATTLFTIDRDDETKPCDKRHQRSRRQTSNKHAERNNDRIRDSKNTASEREKEKNKKRPPVGGWTCLVWQTRHRLLRHLLQPTHLLLFTLHTNSQYSHYSTHIHLPWCSWLTLCALEILIHYYSEVRHTINRSQVQSLSCIHYLDASQSVDTKVDPIRLWFHASTVAKLSTACLIIIIISGKHH